MGKNILRSLQRSRAPTVALFAFVKKTVVRLTSHLLKKILASPRATRACTISANSSTGSISNHTTKIANPGLANMPTEVVENILLHTGDRYNFIESSVCLALTSKHFFGVCQMVQELQVKLDRLTEVAPSVSGPSKSAQTTTLNRNPLPMKLPLLNWMPRMHYILESWIGDNYIYKNVHSAPQGGFFLNKATYMYKPELWLDGVMFNMYVNRLRIRWDDHKYLTRYMELENPCNNGERWAMLVDQAKENTPKTEAWKEIWAKLRYNRQTGMYQE